MSLKASAQILLAKASHMGKPDVNGTDKHNHFTGKSSKSLGTIPPTTISLVGSTSYFCNLNPMPHLPPSRYSGHLCDLN